MLKDIRIIQQIPVMDSANSGLEIARLGLYALAAQIAFGFTVGAVVHFSNPNMYALTNAEQVINILTLPFGAVVAFMFSDYPRGFSNVKKGFLFLATMFLAPLMIVFGGAKYILHRKR